MRGSAMLRGSDATGVIAFAERWVARWETGFVGGGCCEADGAGEVVAQAVVRRDRKTTEAIRRMVLRYSKKKAPRGTETAGGWLNDRVTAY